MYILRKILLCLSGTILLVVGIVLNRTHAIDSGIAMIMGIVAGLLIGAIFTDKDKKK